ncbi:MAG: chromosomal replication initiator protein DnaA [Nitrospirota bacterium]
MGITESKEILWKSTIEELEEHVNKQELDVWFQEVYIDSLRGDDINISVPNKFFGEWLREHYYERLNEILSHKTDGSCNINFIIRQSEGTTKKDNKGEVIRGEQRRKLIRKYRFDTFVVGSSNQFAHAASLAVAESPAKAYNPLFIYGGVGLGKTHLLNAIGNFTLDNNNREVRSIVYASSEQFTNEVINSIRNDKMVEFRRKYRNVDMLLIDDIQFISGKERTQEEFFHTFNTLYERSNQIVITSDRFPKDIPSIEERLRSRFECGLIADIQPPDIETRMAIIKEKSETEGLEISREISFFLASNMKENIRELEGALIRLGAFSSLTGREITVDMARIVLRDTIDDKKKIITVDDIQRAVCGKFHIKMSEIKAKKRTKTLVLPRQLSMYLCRELTDLSFPEIGKHFGGKDHTTVIHACKQIENKKEKDAGIDRILEELIYKIKEK